jgi:lipid-binding SYLF domain-containing protein
MKSTRGRLVGFLIAVNLWLMALTSFGWAAGDHQADVVKRLGASAAVLDEIMANSNQAIPKEVLAEAKCIAVVPSFVDIALGIGGRHGKGVSTCRVANAWSAPAPITFNGGSIGLEAGAKRVDLVMIVMNQNALNRLLLQKFKVGTDVTGQAGPVGSEASGDPSWKQADILSYSRSRGAFRGIDFKGIAVRQDKNATVALYGRYIPFASILTGKVPAPAVSETFLTTIRKYTAGAPQEGALGSPPPVATGHDKAARTTSF